MKKVLFTAVCVAISACSGSGSNYEPITLMKNENYTRDLQDCQNLSKKRDYLNINNIDLSQSMSALTGAFKGNGDTMADVAQSMLKNDKQDDSKTNKQKQSIIVQCLRVKGHKVIL
ncbi:MAG: hypothetical protein ACI9CD_000898 [Candidatus Deianiraeaceae bacterium]|jgi:hypothetical protein